MKTERGQSYPLGSTVKDGGVNFSVYSRSSTSLELLLFEGADDPAPRHSIRLDPDRNRTFNYWHAFVPGLKAGQVYAFRVGGPFAPERGHRFDREKVLLDPYSKAIIARKHDRKAASRPGDNVGTALRSIVVDTSEYDWEGDAPLGRAFSETVIYETHLAGFTRHVNSGISPEKRGTYAGLIEKIPYLVDLGITAVELLPVFHFDEHDAPEGLTNYWGYSPVSFFAPHRSYSSRKDLTGPVDEFRDLVKALHRAGIEIILDVVYNHTSEGDETGPTLSFKGLENSVYYIRGSAGESYANYTGTGNTLNANHSIVRRLIMDSLHYWVTEMHVDGFRFDLASILSRDEDGRPMADPPVLWEIESDPVLAGTKLIAEAWDAAGLYQVGSFIGDRWKEWNGRFRDDVRSFLRGDRRTVSNVASRFLASPDLYGHEEREPEQSVNFVTCHDGFTLNDLVTYERKHNKANREGNRDGSDNNLSWNLGVEGPTDDPGIQLLRERQVKNYLTINLLALGVPMLLMGDEARRTQGGNNNAYCQDNPTSWFDWDLVSRNSELVRFVKLLIQFRLNLDVVRTAPGLSLNRLLESAGIRWHGVELDTPDWGDDSHSLAFTVQSLTGSRLFHVMLNAYCRELEFEIPQKPGEESVWRRLIDTSLPSPDDIREAKTAPRIHESLYPVAEHSVVVLVSEFRG